MTKSRLTILNIFLFSAILIAFCVFPTKALASYNTAGILTSTNILSALGASRVHSFVYTATSIPSGTSLKIQFSTDNAIWYDSAGTNNALNTLSVGTNTIDLSALNLRTATFYYKVLFNSDGVNTPVLDSVGLNIMDTFYTYNTYNTDAFLVSKNLLSGQSVSSISSFGYTATDIPSGTSLKIQFSQDNSLWYSSAGVLGGQNTLSAGTNTISLAALNWSAANFYYKMEFISNGNDTPVLDSVNLNFYSPATYYWVGGSGNWSDAAHHWATSSGGTAGAGNLPASVDSVVFDSNSGSGTTTLDSAVTVANLTLGAGNTVDLAGNALTVSGTFSITGTLKLKGSETVSSTPTLNTGSVVTYAGDTSAVAVKNWSYKTLTMNAPGKTFNFTAAGNYTVATAWNVNGTAGNPVTLRSTSTGNQWNIAVPASRSLSYIDVKDSNNTGTAIDATNATLFTDSGNNAGWTFDTIPPTTSASATSNGTSYTFGNWTGHNVTVTLSCADNPGGTGCASGYPKYCIDTSNICTPTTTYTAPVAVSTEGISYIRYYSTDQVPNTESTNSKTIKIDTTAPATVASTIRDANSVTITLTCADTMGSGCTYIYYCIDAQNTCTPTTVYTTPVSYQITQNIHFRFYSVDAVSNISSTVSQPFNTTGGQAVEIITPYSQQQLQVQPTPAPIPAPTPTPVPQPVEQPTQQSTLQTTVLNQVAQQITTIAQQLAQTPQQLIQNIQNISQKVADVSKQIAQLIVPPLAQPPGLQGLPPIAEAVPRQAPLAFESWGIMTVKPIGELKLNLIGGEIGFFAEKLPKLNETLQGLAINIDKAADLLKLSGVELYIPGLTKTVLTQAEILKINNVAKQAAKNKIISPETNPENISPGNQIAKPEVSPQGEQKTAALGGVQVNPFAAVQGVPTVELSADALAKMPTDVMFARAAGGLIDFNISLAVVKAGNVTQKLSMISGKPVELVIKPDMPAEKVTGYVTLEKSAAELNQENKKLSLASRFLNAALLTSLDNIINPKAEQGTALLLQKFEYKEIKTGVFSASITAPVDEGEYKILSVIKYKDQTLAPKETQLTVMVDPEGYVFSQTPDGRLRIQGAKVSIYWFDSDTGKYDLWPADKFLQKNPVATDETGKYSFLLPQGRYYLQAEAPGYSTYKGDSFEVKENIGVHEDIELKKWSWLPSWFDWQAVIAILLLLIVVMMGVAIVLFIKKRRLPK